VSGTSEDTGALAASRCDVCGRVQWYPRLFCGDCLVPTVPADIRPHGTVYSVTTVHRATAGFDHLVPYDVVLVDCDGYRVLALAAGTLPIGARVRISRIPWKDLPTAVVAFPQPGVDESQAEAGGSA
jgi:uncharacterized OB-fold protein